MIFRSNDGTLVFCDSFQVESPRASILVVHGIGEHSGRYQELVKICNKAKLDVHVFDLRGHGRSQGLRGHFNSMDEHYADMDGWIEFLVSQKKIYSDLPLLLLGHSLGGLIATGYAAQYIQKPLYPSLRGLVLSAPALGLKHSLFKKVESQLAKHVPGFFKKFQVPTGLDATWLTHDKDEIEKYRNDPLVHGWITPAAFIAMEAAMSELPQYIAQLNMNTLFLLGGKDRIVSVDAALKFSEKLKVAHPGRTEVRVFHSFFHEPFHEAKRERAFLELKKWTLKCLTSNKANSKKNLSRSSARGATAKAILL